MYSIMSSVIHIQIIILVLYLIISSYLLVNITVLFWSTWSEAGPCIASSVEAMSELLLQDCQAFIKSMPLYKYTASNIDKVYTYNRIKLLNYLLYTSTLRLKSFYNHNGIKYFTLIYGSMASFKLPLGFDKWQVE